ncbi:MAG TPA: TetR/AcrR family transcriptional regulator [Candidatus Agrococcus pullicola]|uniref:TetR/AcrR family transcriptional regulator n=1 Tax=Candidatus Agrococcus pullicola TaxID=2838429 RepID=A0A9D1YWW8_9MICO|nr:TetR/AcrR family transcriptional regulator [Candidatus Agrococcus pullicola]
MEARTSGEAEEGQVSIRLDKGARRAQLLDVAYDVITEEGTGNLTLARLAERAGVSKPIAYDHFGTRAGLLAALFRSFDEQQIERMRAALAEGGDSLQETAKIAASGYMDCLLSAGSEYEEICAALLAYEETKDFLQESRDRFIEEYRRVFSPFVSLEDAHGRALLTSMVGSAEGLARDVHHGTLGNDEAVESLTGIMLATLTPLVK